MKKVLFITALTLAGLSCIAQKIDSIKVKSLRDSVKKYTEIVNFYVDRDGLKGKLFYRPLDLSNMYQNRLDSVLNAPQIKADSIKFAHKKQELENKYHIKLK